MESRNTIVWESSNCLEHFYLTSDHIKHYWLQQNTHILYHNKSGRRQTDNDHGLCLFLQQPNLNVLAIVWTFHIHIWLTGSVEYFYSQCFYKLELSYLFYAQYSISRCCNRQAVLLSQRKLTLVLTSKVKP